MSEPVSSDLTPDPWQAQQQTQQPRHTAEVSLAGQGLVRLIRGYQRHLSALKGAPTCRFTPTCSEYAAQAIARHGAVKGGWLALWRIARCNPLTPGGHDPVPATFPPSRTTPIQHEK